MGHYCGRFLRRLAAEPSAHHARVCWALTNTFLLQARLRDADVARTVNLAQAELG